MQSPLLPLLGFWLGGAVAMGGVLLAEDRNEDEDTTSMFVFAVLLWPVAVLVTLIYPKK